MAVELKPNSEVRTMKYFLGIVIGAGILVSVSMPSMARELRAAAINLDPSQIQELIDDDGKTVTCGYVEDVWIPGSVRNQTLFTSLNDQIKALRVKGRKLSGSKLAANNAKVKKLRARSKIETALCLEQAVSPTPQPTVGPGMPTPTATPAPTVGPGTPTPTATPTPTPTATPSGCTSYFSGNDVTACGKVAFGISSALSANVGTGLTQYQSECAGCHNGVFRPADQGANLTFAQLRVAIAGPGMSITTSQVTDAELAHIVAYLKGFKSPS